MGVGVVIGVSVGGGVVGGDGSGDIASFDGYQIKHYQHNHYRDFNGISIINLVNYILVLNPKCITISTTNSKYMVGVLGILRVEAMTYLTLGVGNSLSY